MPTIIHDNFNLKKKELLDSRLLPVDTFSQLPVLNVATSFIPEGAIVLVRDTQKNYQTQKNPNDLTQLIWVDISQESDGLVLGEISISPVNSTLNLNLVFPDITRCYGVLVKVTDGANLANINSILNFPENKEITFFTEPGKTLTFIHTNYDVSNANNSIVLEDGFDFQLNGRYDANESLTLKKNQFKIVQVNATQFIKKSEIQDIIIASSTVIDNLTSTNTTQALSANQGRILNSSIATKMNIFTAGTKLSFVGSVLNALPVNFISVNTSLTGTDYDSILTNITTLTAAGTVDPDLNAYFPVTSNDYRAYYNATEGIYILNPSLPRNVLGNWVKIFAIPISNNDLINVNSSSLLTGQASTNQYYKIGGGSDSVDTSNLYNSTTRELTINKTGYYEINYKIRFKISSTLTEVPNLVLKKNTSANEISIDGLYTPSGNFVSNTEYSYIGSHIFYAVQNEIFSLNLYDADYDFTGLTITSKFSYKFLRP
jgi:hypothetical protein